MGLETGNLPDQLNTAWPLAGDPTSQGDDHIRLVKAVVDNWAGTWGGDQIDTLAKAYADAGDAILQTNIDANTTALGTKADLDGAALLNATLDGAEIVTDGNYSLLPTPLGDVTPSFPADNGQFILASANVVISGTPGTGHRIDIFAAGGDVTVTGAGGNFHGFGSVGTTLTIAGGFGASIINNGAGWYVMGNGSIA